MATCAGVGDDERDVVVAQDAEHRARGEDEPRGERQPGQATRRQRLAGGPRHDVVERGVRHAEQPEDDDPAIDEGGHEGGRHVPEVEEQVGDAQGGADAQQPHEAEERDAGEPGADVGGADDRADGGDVRGADHEGAGGEPAGHEPRHRGERRARPEVEDVEERDPAGERQVPDEHPEVHERLADEPPSEEPRRHEHDGREPGIREPAIDRCVEERVSTRRASSVNARSQLNGLIGSGMSNENVNKVMRMHERQGADAGRDRQPHGGGDEESGGRAVGPTGDERATAPGRLVVRSALLRVAVHRHRARSPSIGLAQGGVGGRIVPDGPRSEEGHSPLSAGPMRPREAR